MAPAIIMPLFVSHFTSNSVVIGLIAVINASGFFLPQLFTAKLGGAPNRLKEISWSGTASFLSAYRCC